MASRVHSEEPGVQVVSVTFQRYTRPSRPLALLEPVYWSVVPDPAVQESLPGGDAGDGRAGGRRRARGRRVKVDRADTSLVEVDERNGVGGQGAQLARCNVTRNDARGDEVGELVRGVLRGIANDLYDGGEQQKRGHRHCGVTVRRQHSYAVAQSCRDRRLRQTAIAMEGPHQQHCAVPQTVGWPHLLVADGRDGGDAHHVVGGRGLRVLVVARGPVPALRRCKPLVPRVAVEAVVVVVRAECHALEARPAAVVPVRDDVELLGAADARSEQAEGFSNAGRSYAARGHTHDPQLTCTSPPRSKPGGCTCCPSECATGCGSIRSRAFCPSPV